ncbi:MAG: ribose 5-phosphate isomerase A [Candidatus Bathyarchaeota archaeon B24]|nr:MAG: ribose 5-phosphate isomerase A [Candidatus Bathyarchaeota archaeon B24]RLI26652.1 MAG: ribose 5-phosphate isomerase A [Candidatus Bathyarchaeota archaeon]
MHMSSTRVRKEKELVARYASSLVKDGQVVGLGSGTTAAIFVRELAKRVMDEGLKIVAIPSSIPIKLLTLSLAIPTASLDEYPEVDIDVDGADEVDRSLNLLKGGSYGVFTSEKILAASSKTFIVIADHRKPVKKLHTRFPIPLEVLKDARSLVFRRLKEMGGEPKLRVQKVDGEEVPLMTERGNLIVEVWFRNLEIGFRELDDELRRIPGVLETGLFLGMTDMVCIGVGEEVRVFKRGEKLPEELLT